MERLGIANSMLELIGRIPLVRLQRIGRETGAEILVKPEFLNPSGSIKDRIAKLMIERAENAGKLREGSTIIEATSGNTGTALAFVAAVKGYPMKAYAPTVVANPTRMAIMLAFGAELNAVDTSGPLTSGAAHGGRTELRGREICLELERDDPSLWWARQFSSPENVEAHRVGTAAEILESTGGKLDAFVASVGTGGTLLGVADTLKQHDRKIQIVAVEPGSSPMLQDPNSYPIVKGISDGIIPDIVKSGLMDRAVTVTNEEAIDMAHRLAREEGIFAGMSSGANVLACLRIAAELGRGKRVVTVLPDSRDRYLEVEKYTT